jgi:hypothetical protein
MDSYLLEDTDKSGSTELGMVISNQKLHWARVLFSFNHFRLYAKPSEALSDFLHNRFG